MLCPRRCGSFRSDLSAGGRAPYCGESSTVRLAYVGPHFGEEPPISGVRGSGTVFFSGCSLKCSYCQNHQITLQAMGKPVTLEELFDLVKAMIDDFGVHNINMVTPDHFFPDVFRLVGMLKRGGYELPIIYNLSGYQSVEMIREAESRADIYLPDYKYSDGKLSAALSGCGNYPRIALEAIYEMVRQKGFLDRCGGTSSPASRGVLVRHLILPGHIENSLAAVTSLFVEFGRELPVSLMSQYRPVVPQKDEELNRKITEEEFNIVYQYVQELGFENLFVQFPEEKGRDGDLDLPLVPDFRIEKPFER
ncbi:MAG: 4Fe-4S cluster-binding domain-containing protein [Desulfatiglandaceae bacterium]